MKNFGIPPPAFRFPQETRLGAVTLQVAELTRSLAYYEEVLGFTALEQTGAEATLAAGGRALVRLRERRGVRPVPRGGLLGLFHFAILLPERAALGRLVTHLAAMRRAAGSADHAVSEALYLTDPDGLGIEVYADRPRSTWRTAADGELHMITAPLDLAGLVEAAKGERWTGMPAGTVLGHVHLHVGNLEQASAFYHSALGFDKTVWTYPGALFFSAGGYHHHLGTNTWSAGPPSDDGHARLLSWDIIVPRADQAAAAADSLRASKYTVVPLDEHSWSASDPWGTTLRIVGSRESVVGSR